MAQVFNFNEEVMVYDTTTDTMYLVDENGEAVAIDSLSPDGLEEE